MSAVSMRLKPVDGLAKSEEHRLIRRVHADENGHTEHDAGDGQHPAQRMLAHVRPTDELQQDHAKLVRPTGTLPARSSAIRPSQRAMTRAQLSATCGSCVTDRKSTRLN